MPSTDPTLGQKVNNLLVQQNLETPMFPRDKHNGRDKQHEVIQRCHHQTMTSLGLDMEDDSLRDTPNRIAKMYCDEIFTGLDYSNFPKCTTVENKMGYQEMVAVNNITVQSMCEHHFLPFVGTANIAYIPNKKVLGLSKFNRIVDFFSRRPQIQERLNEQIATALAFILETEDVAVAISADHYCVKLRGVRDVGSHTVTSRVLGKFKTVPELRSEWLTLTTSANQKG